MTHPYLIRRKAIVGENEGTPIVAFEDETMSKWAVGDTVYLAEYDEESQEIFVEHATVEHLEFGGAWLVLDRMLGKQLRTKMFPAFRVHRTPEAAVARWIAAQAQRFAEAAEAYQAKLDAAARYVAQRKGVKTT